MGTVHLGDEQYCKYCRVGSKPACT